MKNPTSPIAAARMNERSPDFFELLSDITRVARYDHSVSVPQLGSLFHFDPSTLLGMDQQRLADIFHVPFVWPSTNGTTAANSIALAAATLPGDTVLIQRDAHTSIFAPIIHLGLRPVYIMPPFAQTLGISLGVTPAHLQEALDRHPEARAVVLTYPNYFGVATDLQACAQLVAQRGIPLIVDSAHGAHLQFHPDLPPAAELSGASIVTHSTHKTCSALSQGSLTLFNDTALVDRFYEVVNQLGFVSTSFSYVILQSVILAVMQLELQGKELLGEAMAASEWARAEINRTDMLWSFGSEQRQAGFTAFDPLRVTVDVSRLGMTGFAVTERLIREFQLYPEMATLKQILFLLTLSDDMSTAQRIVTALRSIVRHTSRGEIVLDVPRPSVSRQLCSPRDAFYSRARRRVPITDAIGLPSAESISTYPPGTAILVAGEEITSDIVEYLRTMRAHGGMLKGATDQDIMTITVVETPAGDVSSDPRLSTQG